MATDETAAKPETAKDAADDEKAERDALEALDLARGDVNDDDLDGLEQAIDDVDFASRRAAPERLERLRALAARLQDLVGQIEKGVRKRAPDRQLSPEDEKRYDELVAGGVAVGEKGDLHAAREKLEAAVAIDPDEPSGLFNLGVIYGRIAEVEATRGDFYDSHVPDEVYAEKAVFCYERVLELDPQNARALTNLGAMYDLQGETDLAKDALRRALQADPNEQVAKEHLADLESRA